MGLFGCVNYFNYFKWIGPYFEIQNWKSLSANTFTHAHTMFQSRNSVRASFLSQCKYFLQVWLLPFTICIVFDFVITHFGCTQVTSTRTNPFYNDKFSVLWIDISNKMMCLYKEQELTLIHFPRNLNINPRIISLSKR